MPLFLFYFFSALALLSASLVVLLPKPTRALLSLIVTIFSLSIIYVLLGAPFFAMANLIVYAGAVLVLFLFVIMLQGIGARDIPLLQRFKTRYLFTACFTAATFFIIMLMLFTQTKIGPAAAVEGGVEAIAAVLFKDYLLPFELTSLLLLIGVFAAVSLAKKEDA